MLDPNAIAAAVGLNQKYAGLGVSLTPIPDTPLSMICRECPSVGLSTESSTYEGASTHLVDVSRGEEHAQLMAQSVELASGAVRRTLDFTRNTVFPHIRRVVEKYTTAMASLSSCPLPYDLDAQYVPEVYRLAPGRSFVEQWESTPRASSPGAQNFGNYSPEEVISLAKLTDDGDFNSSMKELLEARNGEGVNLITQVLDGRMDVEKLPTEYVLPLAIVIKNIEMPKEGLQTTVASYNNARALIANIAGHRALGAIRQADTAFKNLSLYPVVTSAKPGCISVNGEVWSELLEQKFSLEMLIGNEILGRKFRGAQLNDAAARDAMLSAYEGDKARRQAAHELNKKVAERAAVQNVLRDDIKCVAECGEFTVEGDTYDKAWGRLRDFIDAVYKNQFVQHDPVMVISAAICLVWYGHTDAARVVDIMYTIEKEQPSLPANQVATLATLKYLCAWVTSQITVSVAQH